MIFKIEQLDFTYTYILNINCHFFLLDKIHYTFYKILNNLLTHFFVWYQYTYFKCNYLYLWVNMNEWIITEILNALKMGHIVNIMGTSVQLSSRNLLVPFSSILS